MCRQQHSRGPRAEQCSPTTGSSQDHRKGGRAGLKWLESCQLELRERELTETSHGGRKAKG